MYRIVQIGSRRVIVEIDEGPLPPWGGLIIGGLTSKSRAESLAKTWARMLLTIPVKDVQCVRSKGKVAKRLTGKSKASYDKAFASRMSRLGTDPIRLPPSIPLNTLPGWYRGEQE